MVILNSTIAIIVVAALTKTPASRHLAPKEAIFAPVTQIRAKGLKLQESESWLFSPMVRLFALASAYFRLQPLISRRFLRLLPLMDVAAGFSCPRPLSPIPSLLPKRKSSSRFRPDYRAIQR
jgi:hypothetical protein